MSGRVRIGNRTKPDNTLRGVRFVRVSGMGVASTRFGSRMVRVPLKKVRSDRGREGPQRPAGSASAAIRGQGGGLRSCGSTFQGPARQLFSLTFTGFAMPRRPDVDSAGEVTRIMQGAGKPIHPPSTVPLEKGDLPFFASIFDEFARSEWTAHQLELAAMLARTMADLEREQRELREEGSVSVTDQGTPVVNPRKTVVQMHAGTIFSFRRSLQLNARAQLARFGYRPDRASPMPRHSAKHGHRSMMTSSANESDPRRPGRPVHSRVLPGSGGRKGPCRQASAPAAVPGAVYPRASTTIRPAPGGLSVDGAEERQDRADRLPGAGACGRAGEVQNTQIISGARSRDQAASSTSLRRR